MFFWFKKKEIVLDCFTDDIFAYEYCKIAESTYFYPEWWKNLPKENKNQNMISCKGFTGLYKNSFIIPSWARIRFEQAKGEEQIHWKSPSKIGITKHFSEQYTGLTNYKYTHLKLASPWFLKCNNKKINFIWLDPLWNRSDFHSYSVVPASLNYYYNNTTHVNFFFELKPQGQVVDLVPGEPLVMLIPQTEDKIKLNLNMVDSNYIEGNFRNINFLNQYSGKDSNLYNLKKKIIDKNINIKNGKCPFS